MKPLRLIFCFVFLLLFSVLSAQDRDRGTHFFYDASGNRTLRNTFVVSDNTPVNREVLAEVDSLGFFTYFGDILDSEDLPEGFYTDKLNESDVVIYPNPTRGVLAVEIRNKNPEIPHHLTVFRVNGAVVFERLNISNYTQIDLFSQPSGLYLLRIFSGDTFITWRIIKE